MKDILLSNGWKLEKDIYYFIDGSSAECDTLVYSMIRTDSKNDKRIVFTERWLVFTDDTTAVTAYSYDLYSRPEGAPVWSLGLDSLHGVGAAIWGMEENLKIYMNR